MNEKFIVRLKKLKINRVKHGGNHRVLLCTVALDFRDIWVLEERN